VTKVPELVALSERSPQPEVEGLTTTGPVACAEDGAPKERMAAIMEANKADFIVRYEVVVCIRDPLVCMDAMTLVDEDVNVLR
jgi:hypothetical protein